MLRMTPLMFVAMDKAEEYNRYPRINKYRIQQHIQPGLPFSPYLKENNHRQNVLAKHDSCHQLRRHKVINIGSKTYPLEPLSKYEYLKDNKWIPFTVEVADTPAKFQAGKKYFYYDDDDYENEIFINAKYVDPKDKAVTVVFEDVAVRIVKLDSDGNEYIDCNDSEDGSIKAINEVKREE